MQKSLFTFKKMTPLFFAMTFTLQSLAQQPVCGLISQVDIPASGKEKIIKFFLDPNLKSINKAQFTKESLADLMKPQSVEVPEILYKTTSHPFNMSHSTSQLTNAEVKEIFVGASHVNCDNATCTVAVPILRASINFGLKINTVKNENVFNGDNLALTIGTPDLLESSTETLAQIQNKSIESILDQTPQVIFKVAITKSGPMSETLRVIESPSVFIPSNSTSLHMNLTPEEMNLADNAGKLKVFDQILSAKINAKTNQDKIAAYDKQPESFILRNDVIAAYLAGAGNQLIRMGRFKDVDSYNKFMILKQIAKSSFFNSREVMDFLALVIRKYTMPDVMNFVNKSMSELRELNEVMAERPQIILQNEVDFEKNTAETTRLVTRMISERQNLTQQEISEYFSRFNSNSDFRSLELVNSFKSNSLSAPNLSKESLAYIQQQTGSAVQVIQNNIKLKTKNILLQYSVEPTGDFQQNLRLTAHSENYCNAIPVQNSLPEIKFNSQCDLVNNLPISTVNAWLKELQTENDFDVCIARGKTELCDLKSKKFLGVKYEIPEAPRLEWDEAKSEHVLVIPRINRDAMLTIIPLSSLLGLTKDALSAKIPLHPQSCDDGKFCMNPGTPSTLLLINNTSLPSKITGVFKMLALPYSVLGNLLVSLGINAAKNEVSKAKTEIPKFKIIEIQSQRDMISICGQIKN